MQDIFFSLKDVIQLLTVAFSFGVLVSTVRTLAKAQKVYEAAAKERMDKLEERQDEIDNKFITVIEKFSKQLSSVGDELKALLARHDTRITVLEDRTKQHA